MKIYDIGIIGGGAAGLMAAVQAAKNKSVVIIEGNKKLGKKLLATGNGRCNLTNSNLQAVHYHGDFKELEPLLANYDTSKIINEFEKLGILTAADDEGRIYPKNLQAASVLKALADTCAEKGVDCMLEFTAFSVVKSGGSFIIKADDGRELRVKAVVLACGGLASPNHGCGTQGISILKQLGHSTCTMYPALTALCTEDKFVKGLGGMRCKAVATLIGDGKLIATRKGEVIFAEKGISGICVFDLSIYAGELFATGKIAGVAYNKLSLELDLCPDININQLKLFMEKTCTTRPAMPVGDVLMGVINKKVGLELVRSCGVDTMAPISSLKQSAFGTIAGKVKTLSLNITETKGYKEAQITAGGVPLNEVNLATMESRLCKNLYLAGEVLNIHGDCGGYNLHWAWLTGIIAGKAAADKIIVL